MSLQMVKNASLSYKSYGFVHVYHCILTNTIKKYIIKKVFPTYGPLFFQRCQWKQVPVTFFLALGHDFFICWFTKFSQRNVHWVVGKKKKKNK